MRLKQIPGAIMLSLLAGAALSVQASTVEAGGTAEIRKHGAFAHPGVLHTQADFERMKAKVAARQEPWTLSWERLQKSPHGPGWKPSPGSAFYTTDDGATLFTDGADRLPPFDHDGKAAVMAAVFSCDNGKHR